MRVAVVGGGLAGCSAAHELRLRGHEVRIVEASSRLGGQVETRREHGFVVELGAEGFVARSTAIPELCLSLGLESELVPQTTTRALAWRGGRMIELGPGEAARLLGIAAHPDDLGRGLVTLRSGMGALVEGLVARSPGLVVSTGVRVERLEAREERWTIAAGTGEPWTADAVILAVPPAEAARLLAPIARDDATALVAERAVVSPVTVSLAYRRSEVGHGLDASGVVIEPDTRRTSPRACTFSSTKFADRAPAGWCLVRAFFDLAAGDRADAAWIDAAHRALQPMLGLSGPPGHAWVARWPDALPRDRSEAAAASLTALADRVRALGRLEPAWVGVDGIGLDGAVRAGLGAARRLGGARQHSVA